MATDTANIGINHGISYNKELVIPQFADVETMNAYIPKRAGALAQVGEDTYIWTGSEWVKIAKETDISASTFRADTLNDL